MLHFKITLKEIFKADIYTLACLEEMMIKIRNILDLIGQKPNCVRRSV